MAPQQGQAQRRLARQAQAQAQAQAEVQALRQGAGSDWRSAQARHTPAQRLELPPVPQEVLEADAPQQLEVALSPTATTSPAISWSAGGFAAGCRDHPRHGALQTLHGRRAEQESDQLGCWYSSVT